MNSTDDVPRGEVQKTEGFHATFPAALNAVRTSKPGGLRQAETLIELLIGDKTWPATGFPKNYDIAIKALNRIGNVGHCSERLWGKVQVGIAHLQREKAKADAKAAEVSTVASGSGADTMPKAPVPGSLHGPMQPAGVSDGFHDR